MKFLFVSFLTIKLLFNFQYSELNLFINFLLGMS